MTLTGQGPDRVAIVAPTGREAEAIADLLREDGAIPVVCDGLAAVVAELPSCGLAVLTEEAVIDADLSGLAAAISGQPDWSDLPIVLLTRRGEGLERNAASLRRHMRALGNVTLLERPFHPMTFVSLARTALASRMRQYQARDRLLAIERSQAEIAEGEERLRFVLAAGKLGAWDLHFPERTLSASTLCKTNFGLEPDDLLDYDTFLHLLHPEDRDQVVADAQVAIDTGQAYEVDCRVVTPAGETRWIELRGQATYMAGRPDRIAGVSLDITDRKQAEERQDLLIRELHHRVKNTLSTVQAIIGSTARGAATIDDFYRDFTARIMSLADTHNILTEAIWQKASLHELVSKELKIFDDAHKRIVVSGPEVDLPSDYAVPLGMGSTS